MKHLEAVQNLLEQHRDEYIKYLNKDLSEIMDKAAIFHKKNLYILFGMGTFTITAGKNRDIELHPDFLDKIEDLNTYSQDELKRCLSDYTAYYWKPE